MVQHGSSVVDLYQEGKEDSDSLFICGREELLYVTTKDKTIHRHQPLMVVVIEGMVMEGMASIQRSDEAHFCLNGYVNKQNCRIWSEANPQVYVETPLHPEKLTVWCALWAGGILLQKR
ncbi:hypothetical protein TNCV_5031541 [Trichonephila clavipes]|nr:hypothetical protein TNCV_5031541 [Trichonephila clavipes]